MSSAPSPDKQMTFGKLPGRIEHDINNGRIETLNALVYSFQPFIHFCIHEGHFDTKTILESLSDRLKQKVGQGRPHLHEFKEIIDNLRDKIAAEGLDKIEPTILFQKIDIYQSPQGLRLGIHLENDLIRKTFLLLLENKYRFYRSYEFKDDKDRFIIKDIRDDGDSVILCGASLADTLINHGFSANKIVSMDFQRPNTTLENCLIMPFEIEKLDELFSKMNRARPSQPPPFDISGFKPRKELLRDVCDIDAVVDDFKNYLKKISAEGLDISPLLPSNLHLNDADDIDRLGNELKKYISSRRRAGLYLKILKQ